MIPEGPAAGRVLAWVHPSAISRTRNILLSAPANVGLALLPLAVVPVYIRLIGPEAYGLIVLNATMLATILFLDRLMGPAIIREFGRKNGDDAEAAGMGDLLRSFEGVAILLGTLAAAATFVALPLVTDGWRERIGLDAGQMRLAFALMALSIGLQWPGLLYTSGLIGLQRQALASTVRLAGALLLHGGGIGVLLYLRTDVIALLAWQTLAIFVQSLAMRWIAWSAMPGARSATSMRPEILRSVWPMAVGSLILGVASALLTQIDKLMVARLASPDQFVAYGLSFAAAGAIFNVLSGPFTSAMNPHFAGLLADSNQTRLGLAYARWSQTLALFVFPVAGGLITFAAPLVELWLGLGGPVAAEVRVLLPAAALGVMFITLLSPAAILQSAAGWNGLLLACHLGTTAALLVGLPWVLATHGPLGAAWLSAALISLYFVIMAPLMHRKLLPGLFWRSLLNNLLLPGAVTVVVFGLASRVAPSTSLIGVLFAAAVAGLAFLLLLCVLPHGRAQLADSLGFIRSAIARRGSASAGR